MRKNGFRFLLPALFLAPALLQQGSTPAQEKTEFLVRPDLSGVRGGNLVVSVASDPPSFNRMMAPSVSHVTLLDRISADLVHINRMTLELEPSLVKRWEASRDGRVYTLHLRRGLRFSDGAPCTADDVVFSLQALADPRAAALVADQVKVDGQAPSVAKVDDHTIRLTYSRPVGMGIRALDSVPVLPRARLQKALADGTFPSAWGPGTPASEVAGLGPFRLREYERGSRIVLERNPYYWKKDRAGQVLPYLDSITFLVVPDKNTETLRLQAGEIALAGDLSPENYAAMRKSAARAGLELRDLGPGLGMDFIWFNLNPPDPSGRRVDPEKSALFEKPEFRRAVSHAIDRAALVRSILLGLGTPQHGPISSGNKPWYNPQFPELAYEPGRARELLGKAGLRDRDGDGTLEFGPGGRPLEITLMTTRGNSRRERTAQVVRDYLAKVGIRINVQPVPSNELVSRLQNSLEYEAILFGFTPTDVIPDLLADLWYSSGKNHFWHPAQQRPARPWEARLDLLTSQLQRALGQEARRKLFFEMQEIWARELPALTVAAPNVLVAWNARLAGVRASILSPQILWNAEELSWKAR